MSTRPMLKHFSRLRTTRNTATTTNTSTTPARRIQACLYQTEPLLLLPLSSQQTFKRQQQHQQHQQHQYSQKRYLHRRIPRPPVPEPTPFIPDPQAFLTVIGRGLSQHASKIPNWEALFTLTSAELRDLGIEPARSRRYLLRWLERFRHGRFGVGGDCRDVNEDGSAELRIVETLVESKGDDDDGHSTLRRATATRSAGMKRIVVNLSGKSVGMEKKEEEEEANEANEASDKDDPGEDHGNGESAKEPRPMKKRFGLQMHLQLPPEEAERRKVAFVTLKDSIIIKGPHVEPIKASDGGAVGVARIMRKEGIWEDRRGHKVDGGERRRAQVRAKRYSAEKRAAGVQN